MIVFKLNDGLFEWLNTNVFFSHIAEQITVIHIDNVCGAEQITVIHIDNVCGADNFVVEPIIRLF